jgi:hypothetical protein
MRDAGLNACQISRATGVPRATVRDWVAGRTPRRGHERSGRCAACGHAEHARAELPPEYAYLLGIYLGDGCISVHPRGVFRLRVTLDAAYPQIIDEVARSMSAVVPNRVGRRECVKNCVEVWSYSRSWPCLIPQQGPGKKRLRDIRLEPWQWTHVKRHPRLMLRGLIHSDGCRVINTGRKGWTNPRYSFTNLSADIRHIFCETCDLLGLHWTRGGPKTIYVSRKADVARMDEFIGPKA